MEKPVPKVNKAKTKFNSGYGSDDEYEATDYNTLNLNKLSQDEISKHKKIMDKKFDKNFVKAGDPGFVYDKRIEFKKGDAVKIEESWDEDD